MTALRGPWIGVWLALALGAAGSAAAQDKPLDGRFAAEAGLAVYGNDDAVTVFSPWAAAGHQVGAGLTVGAEWHADVISSASVDVVSGATSGFNETRNEGTLSVDGDWGWVLGRLSYTGSFESDTYAHLVRLGGQVELLQRNLTLGLGYGFGYDQLGQVHEPTEIWRDRFSHMLDLSVSQLLSKTTVGSLEYSFLHQSGLLSSPYRRVPLMPRDTTEQRPSAAQWVSERHPDARGRHALAVSVKQALGERVFLTARYRAYLDTWSLRSQTGELSLAVDTGADVTVEVSDRFYYQSRASFYRGIYTVNRDFITRDRRLATQIANQAKLGVRYRGRLVEVLASGELQWVRYDDVWSLAEDTITAHEEVLGWIVQVAVGLNL